jgi:hypothetical protein
VQSFFGNLEVILGSLGYLALFFFGEWVGAAFLWKTVASKWSMEKFCGVLWAIVTRVIPVSRRLTNISICLWVLMMRRLAMARLKRR